ncbi:hypothetical protein, partial [Streptomyces sp. OspMP-M43]|uniref:hypothetical protein n=1 Tax=Streptomyces sp. OspMP-M43 TaxID=1839781 RepID=UPI00081B11DB
ETAPAGLAAAGIEEPVLTTVERADAESEARALPIGHQRAGEWGTETEQPFGADHEVVVNGRDTSVPEAPAAKVEPALPDVDYLAAAEGYVAHHGHFPDAGQFGIFLAQYDVIDTSTRGPLPATLLNSVLDELWTEHNEKFILQEQALSADGSSTEPEPEESSPRPEAEAEGLREQTGGTSAWFGSGPKAPPEETGQDRLEALESWNGASGDTALDDGRSNSSGVPEAAVTSGGATADRTGERRRVVEMRIPDGELPGQAVSLDHSEEQLVGDRTPAQELPQLKGAELVAARYWALSAEDRSKRASSLAPQLAEGTDYTVGTVRKYLGEIKRAERQAAASG